MEKPKVFSSFEEMAADEAATDKAAYEKDPEAYMKKAEESYKMFHNMCSEMKMSLNNNNK
jgi:hypothetical protein